MFAILTIEEIFMTKKDFSKNCLSQALMDLLETHEYSEISIQDIVDKAGFSRMAYYRNFKNTDEMIDYYLDAYFINFINDNNLSYHRMGAEKFFLTVFNFLADPKTRKMAETLDKRGLITHLSAEFVKRIQGGFVPGQSEYFYSFLAGGLFGVYMGWMHSGYKETPEQLAEQAVIITNKIQGKL